MESPSKEGFLTDEQRAVLEIATALNAEVMSTSPRSPTGTIGDHHPLKIGNGRSSTGGRHMRRTHSGKLGRAKKGQFSLFLIIYLFQSDGWTEGFELIL